MAKKDVLHVIAALGCVILMVACGNPGSTSTASGNTNGSTQSGQHFQMGQQVKLDGYVVTVNSIKKSAGDDLAKPKAGDTFVLIDVNIKNTTGQAQVFSSFTFFSLQDPTGKKYNEAIITSTKSPDGKIPSGGSLQGQVPYEVPLSQHTFLFMFRPKLTGTDQAIWDLSYS